MKEKIYILLSKYNIEFYYDKPYTCESVFKELFDRGVIEEIKKSQSN